MKVRDVISVLEQDGWRIVRMKGSHRQFKHGVKPGTVTVAGHPGMDLAVETLKSVWRQAGLGKQR